jgi:tetratricopeptide (TPR) repeat protein
MQTTTEVHGLTPGHVTTEALDALYNTGHWLHARERWRDAAAVFRMLVLCAPEDERGYLALGSCHEGLGQEAIALEIYAAATMTADAPRCHVARARLLRKNGFPDDAEEALDEAASIADALNDDHLRALVANERGAS